MSSFNVILHPTDFTAEAEQAFRLACAIARDHFAEVIVLHVLSPTSDALANDESNDLDENHTDVRLCRERFGHLKALAAEVPVKFRLVAGYAVGVILNVAHEEDADLIVVGSSHRQHPSFQLHGHVADGVLRQAHCPVCCLRQPISSPSVGETKACGTVQSST